MPSAWRLTKTKYLSTAWDGAGARRAGGRWNSPGVPVVYTSETLALALVEILVHLPSGGLPSYSTLPVEFHERLVTTVPLPASATWPALDGTGRVRGSTSVPGAPLWRAAPRMMNATAAAIVSPSISPAGATVAPLLTAANAACSDSSPSPNDRRGLLPLIRALRFRV